MVGMVNTNIGDTSDRLSKGRNKDGCLHCRILTGGRQAKAVLKYHRFSPSVYQATVTTAPHFSSPYSPPFPLAPDLSYLSCYLPCQDWM